MNNRIFVPVLVIVSFLLLGAALGVFTSKYYLSGPPTGPEIEGLLWPDPKAIGPFTAVDHEGKNFGLERLKGKWSFLFFGYTNCPDICPITLNVLDRAYRQLKKQNTSGDVQVIFVSVDPERDTREQLASYVNYFNREFIGLRGRAGHITGLTRQLGVVSLHGEETAPGEYTVDHSASIFLVAPSGNLVALFSAPHEAEDITNRFSNIRSFIEKQG